MVHRFSTVLLLTTLLCGLLHAVEPTPTLPAQVSWVGNSLSGKSAWVPQDIDDLFVAPSGVILTNIAWEEGGGNVTRFTSSGDCLGAAMHTHGWGHSGGEAVCSNATYAFLAVTMNNEGGGLADLSTWPPKGFAWLGVSRRKLSDVRQGAPFPGGKGGKGDTLPGNYLVVTEVAESSPGESLRGLAANERELFVSLRQRGEVLVYDCETMQQKRSLKLPRVDRIVVGTSQVWALQAPEKTTDAWRIIAIAADTGAPLASFTCPLPSMAFT